MIIVNPDSYNKTDAFRQSVNLCQNFFEENKIPQAKFVEVTSKIRPSYGFYLNSTIHCNSPKTKAPVKNPGYHWSYSGAKADLTIPGIVAHEAGHHVDYSMFFNENSRNIEICKQKNPISESFFIATALLHDIFISESQVSSYEPNLKEMFAESMRLFILNPDLLKTGRPLRYRYITEFLKLKPVVFASWEQILEHAHPKLINAQKSWIKNSKIVIPKSRSIHEVMQNCLKQRNII